MNKINDASTCICYQGWCRILSPPTTPSIRQDDDDDGDDDEYKPVWPSGLCATSDGGETLKAYNHTQYFIEAPRHECQPFKTLTGQGRFQGQNEDLPS
jgi:hypothetical protein